MDVVAYTTLAVTAAGIFYFGGKYGRLLWDHWTSPPGRRR